MERKLTAVVLASVVLAGALGATGVGAFGNASAQAGNDGVQTDDGATITSSATGEVTAEPDRAVVSLTVIATGENASQAADRLAENASELRATLDDESLPVVSVQSTGYSVGPVDRGEGGGQGQGEGPPDERYEARQTFAVTTDEVTAAGEIIDAAVDGGADEVRGVRFALSDDRRQELRAEAIDAAVGDARSQAEAAASSTGLSITGVDAVSVDAGVGGPVAFESADAGTRVDPSPVTVSASVQVTYNATGG